MKACLMSIGDRCDRVLPDLLSAFVCGMTAEIPEIHLVRVLLSSADTLTGAFIGDLRACRESLRLPASLPFFKTSLRVDTVKPVLPDRETLSRGSGLLLEALRGKHLPPSYKTDAEMAEWGFSTLLRENSDELAPLRISADDPEEELRIMVLCDPEDPFSEGVAHALLRDLRDRLGEEKIFIGLVCLSQCENKDLPGQLTLIQNAMTALSRQKLVRSEDAGPSAGADAAWLLSLPASLVTREDSKALLRFSAARIMAEVWAGSSLPAPGFHSRVLPGTLTLNVLGAEAPAFAAFLHGSLWCLTDLFPALHQYFDQPRSLLSLAPATRNGLFRRLFKGSPDLFPVFERTLKVILLRLLSLLQSLPDTFRSEAGSDALREEAVQACGRAVTLASEALLARREASESGIDRFSPVHRGSMADTFEEASLRKLDKLMEDLNTALSERNDILTRLGTFGARRVLEDCLEKCAAAEKATAARLAGLPSDSPDDRFTHGLAERRLRQLRAAVSVCEKDLREYRSPDRISASGIKISNPFINEMVDPALAEKCASFLAGDIRPEDLRALRDDRNALFPGLPLRDGKTLLKELHLACRDDSGSDPFSLLCAGVFSLCASDTASLRFPGKGNGPDVPLLPDLNTPDAYPTLRKLPEVLIAPEKSDTSEAFRGLFAMLVLRQYRRRGAEEGHLVIDPVLPSDSPLAAAYLRARRSDKALIVSLKKEGSEKVPFALFLPESGMEPAHFTASHRDMVPGFAVWFDAGTLRFGDPDPFLSEGDRDILREQFTRLRAALNASRDSGLPGFFADWYHRLSASRTSDADPFLRTRLKAACGLTGLPAWQSDLSRVHAFYEKSLPEDSVCACLAGSPFPAAGTRVPDDVLYTFRGTPFARESAVCLLESTSLPGEALLLTSLNTECDLLSHSSDDYRDALVKGLTRLLDRFPKADPEIRKTAEELLEEAKQPLKNEITELHWPWDTASASVRTILSECLGSELAGPALRPFSARLTLFPARGGDVIGDALFGRICVLATETPADPGTVNPAETSPEGPPAADENTGVATDAYLPPLSAGFAAALCRSGRGRTLIREGFLITERRGIKLKTTLTLEGAFTLSLVREWSEEEILRLYSADLPTLALWPSIPFPSGTWHSYFLYTRLPEGYTLTAIPETGAPVPADTIRPVTRLDGFPVCFSLVRQNGSGDTEELGALPDLLPEPDLPPAGDWTACLDFGSSATSLVFLTPDGPRSPGGEEPVRLLLRDPLRSSAWLKDGFLSPDPLRPLFPSVLRIFDPGFAEERIPLRDARILTAPDFGDLKNLPSGSVCTDLKWDQQGSGIAELYLRQFMLMAALRARRSGAVSLGWRCAVPDEMAAGGRERLVHLIDRLALDISRESGLPLPDKTAPAAFASESCALGAYFRFCATEETRGGFLLLDLGAETADISLFLRGREAPVRVVQIPLGIHYMLLPTFLARPAFLSEDFSFLQDPDFLRDLDELTALLGEAGKSLPSLRKARFALDLFIRKHRDLLFSALARRRADGMPGRSGALCLLYFSFLMMLSGLMLLQLSGDSTKNALLPEQMSLCLSGRGTMLMEMLSPGTKASLWRILTMFRNPKVSSLSLLFSAEKKLEIPVGLSCLKELYPGLPPASTVPATLSLRPEELLPEFLVRFAREFPREADLLFPGFYTGDPYAPLSPYGMTLLSEALRQAFPERTNPRPYTALSSWLNTLLELARENGPVR